MGKHMGNDTKAKILVERAMGNNPASVSRKVGRHLMTVTNFLKRYDLRNSLKNKHAINKKNAIDSRQERRICRYALSNRRASLQQIKDDLELSVCKETIRNCLSKNGIFARKMRKKPKLTVIHKLARLEFAREHEN
jgi:hypothetical protein